jgi:hypothetical protein
MKKLPHVLLGLAAAILASCSSPSTRLGRLYESLQADVADRRTGALPDPRIAERHTARAAEVHKMLDAGEIDTPKEKFQAAVLLVETNDAAEMKLAEQLAQEAAQGGEKLAPRVAAEAIDKQLVLLHQPQRYGTQYEWVVALGGWRLYPVDPKTTDADRAAVGVPPIASLREAEQKLNAPYKPK